jgi:hypothetical protein
MRAAGLLKRLSALGVAAQGSVPGAYAWGVTVAPVAWTRGGSTAAKVAAIIGLLALGAGVAGEWRWGGRARVPCFWGFVLASAVTWSAAPVGLSPLRIDAPHGLAGMLGWALFALASAAPALRPPAEENERTEDAPVGPRRLTRGDSAYIAGGAVLAALLQAIGWRIAGAERALLVRFIALAAGLAIVGASTQVALARHTVRSLPSRVRRLRRALVALVMLGLLAVTGVLFAALD